MSGEAVKVVARCRPMNQREKDLKCEVGISILKCLNSRTVMSIFVLFFNLEYCRNRYKKKPSELNNN